MQFTVVLSATRNYGIGHKGHIPWQLDPFVFPDNSAIIISGKYKQQLPANCDVILVSPSTPKTTPSPVPVVWSLQEALDRLQAQNHSYDIYVLGGRVLFENALRHPQCSSVILNQILSPGIECDCVLSTHICEKIFQVKEVSTLCSIRLYSQEDNDDTKGERAMMQQIHYVRRHQEFQYLDIVRNVLDTGNFKPNRTGVPTLSLFGLQMKFSLIGNTIPLLTTKRVPWDILKRELLWMISGSTDVQILTSKGTHIWDEDAERNGGELGPIYGHQWRHFNAPYTTCHSNYVGKGVDQLQIVIDTLKRNPNDRRLLVSAWNPEQLHQMALPPCHVLFQLYVHDGNKLSCNMYQRSADLGLGVPFNIASYSLLTIMVADACGLEAWEFNHLLGDAHVYESHIKALREQLSRKPSAPFPTVSFRNHYSEITEYGHDDILLNDYHPQATIKMPLCTGLNKRKHDDSSI